jgi:antitoxin CcdA
VAAREAGVSLSAALERALKLELAVAKRKGWLDENRDAIATYNSHVRRHGTFSELLRHF